jgi:hypothetical protein
MPAYPWVQRPDDHPLTADEVCEALWEAEGNVSRASVALRVGSLVLRKFVERSPRARAVINESDRVRVDEMRSALYDAGRSEDDRRRDWAIRFVLNSSLARSYGLANAEPASPVNQVNVNLIAQPAQWLDGTSLGQPAPQRRPAKELELHPSAFPATKPGDGDGG